MEWRSCLTDSTLPVVADTSVIINLNATGYSEALLGALPNRLLVVEEVSFELEVDSRTGRNDAEALSALVAQGSVELVRLGDIGTRHFISLVSGPANQTLDDGEAATIACALEQGATALIDERKAIRICAERFGELSTGCTIDIFAQDDVQRILTRDTLADAVFNALYQGRMRIPMHYVEWAVNLIGKERAAQCRSLPASVRSAGSRRS